jgi:hypothetical protein
VKKRYLGLIFLGVVFIVLPFILWMSWVFSEPKQVSIFIMDKTSYSPTLVKNRALNWVLTHRKIAKNDRTLYDPMIDYYGFFPQNNNQYNIHDLTQLSQLQIRKMAKEYSVAYFADSYGIFSDIWPMEDAGNFPAQMIYGGLNTSDFYFLRQMIRNKNLVIAELLFTSEVTRANHKKDVEELLGLQWMGWTGKFFPEFDNSEYQSMPPWVISLYEQQYGKKWDFKNMGVVLVHEDQTIVVLEYPRHLKKPVPNIKSTKPVRDHYKTDDNIPYPGWFEITYSANDEAQMLAWFDLNPTNEGLAILQEHQIPVRFPALIRDMERNLIYMTADFSISPVSRRLVRMKGSRYVELLVADLNNVSDKKAFFFGFYLPFMTQVLKEQQ